MRTTPAPAVPSASGVPVGRHVERAQALWQAAVELAAEAAPGGAAVALELLRRAEYDPSTLRHALTLGDTLIRRRPHDDRLRRGRRLLQGATDWLGVPSADGEVGAADADRRRRSGATREAPRRDGAPRPPRTRAAGPGTGPSRSPRAWRGS